MEPRPLGGSSPPSLSRSLHRKWGKDAAATLRSSRSLVACLSPSACALQANCDKLSRAQQQFATLRHQPATMPGKTCLRARPSFPRMTQPRSFPPCGVFFDVHGSHQLARPRLAPPSISAKGTCSKRRRLRSALFFAEASANTEITRIFVDLSHSWTRLALDLESAQALLVAVEVTHRD